MSQSWRNRSWRDLPLYFPPQKKQPRPSFEAKSEDEEAHQLLETLDEDSEDVHVSGRDVLQFAEGSVPHEKHAFLRRHARALAVFTLLALATLLLGITVAGNINSMSHSDDPSQDIESGHIPGENPPERTEWRSLSKIEQKRYIKAVKCLQSLPPSLPRMPTNASSYSDFSYIHAHIGYRTHHSASFLPWHRYFLHIFENRLRKKCGHQGGIPYWDWTLDADDLGSSPVFDPMSGFGGNGDPEGDIVAGRHGRCVIDGPFAGLQVLWYDVKYQPHCLSRGFRSDDKPESGFMDGSSLRSDEIEKIMDQTTYEDFVISLEEKVHDVIPFGVGGDFETFSAPFEPLFWLHHSQLDRLWWIWQSRHPERLMEYGGHKLRHSIEQAGLDDEIEMGKVIGSNQVVRNMMDIRGGCDESSEGILCYTYRWRPHG